MKAPRPSAIAVLFCALAATCLVLAQSKPDEKPKTWEEKATERFGDTPTPEQKTVIEAAVPSTAPAPAKERKVLVFYRCEGFIHTSIPFANHALKQIGEKTGAFTASTADQYDVFSDESLEKFDAIIFNNSTGLNPNESQRKAILEFINSGKGIVGLHAAADNFGKWDEGIALIGGIFNGHPWGGGGTWAFKVEDPGHPINAAFNGKGFWHKDEIYWYKPENFQGREKLRVLLSLDQSKMANQTPVENEKFAPALAGKKPTEVDVPVSWCREVGQGRLFFTNLGHNDATFSDSVMLQHMLDGIRYALGDLPADPTPSARVTPPVTVVLAPDAPPAP